MASGTVKEFSCAWWAEVHNRIIGAVVFIDDAAAECLHWEGGLFKLMFQGAARVLPLSVFTDCPSYLRKAVFITQTTSRDQMTIRDLIKKNNFNHCTLITTTSLDVMFGELIGDDNAWEEVTAGQAAAKAVEVLTNMLYDWMESEETMVDVIHVPIFTISMTSVVFTTPPFAHLFSAIQGKLIKEPVLDMYSIPFEDRTEVRRLASALNSMLDSMNLKEDVYYMGNYSSLVAGVLDNWPVSLNRRRNCQHPSSLIIVDRTLDLCSVSSHSSETVIDKLRALLPTLPGHHNECAVDMSALCCARSTRHPKDTALSPGCIYHAEDFECRQTYEHMLNKTQPEVMFDVYTKLAKIDVHKSPSPKNLMKVTAQGLEKIVNAYKGAYNVIFKHMGLLQQTLGLVQMHKSPKRATLELLMNLEKQVQQSLATSRESTSVLSQIANLISTRKQKDIPLLNLLALLINVYSLTGTEVLFSSKQEDELTEALSDAICDEFKTLFPDLEDYDEISCDHGRRLARDIMQKLNSIKNMRQNLQNYNSLLKPCESGDGYEYKGLLQQMVEDLVNTSRPDMPDLQRRNDGIKDMFRTGLNMLSITGKKLRGPKHPLDNQTVIIFIIGGTTGEECKRLHRAVITSGVDNIVIFGGTRFQTAQEAAQQFLQISAETEE